MSFSDVGSPIVVVKGDDTNFNGQQFLTLRLNTEVWDLSEFEAVFTLCGITKKFDDISSGVIEINFSSQETASMPFGKQNGVLRLYDQTHRRATIESLIPFEFVSVVHGDAIATRPYEMTINVEQDGENILEITVEAGVSVEVGTTTTLPAGSDATVENVGTPNHLVLDFGIPHGIQGEKGDKGDKGDTGNGISRVSKTSSSGLVDTYTIYFTNGQTTSFNVENGNGIASITKTGSVGLVDTYRITYTNGQTFTFNVTNGEDATIIIRRL